MEFNMRDYVASLCAMLHTLANPQLAKPKRDNTFNRDGESEDETSTYNPRSRRDNSRTYDRGKTVLSTGGNRGRRG